MSHYKKGFRYHCHVVNYGADGVSIEEEPTSAAALFGGHWVEELLTDICGKRRESFDFIPCICPRIHYTQEQYLQRDAS